MIFVSVLIWPLENIEIRIKVWKSDDFWSIIPVTVMNDATRNQYQAETFIFAKKKKNFSRFFFFVIHFGNLRDKWGRRRKRKGTTYVMILSGGAVIDNAFNASGDVFFHIQRLLQRFQRWIPLVFLVQWLLNRFNPAPNHWLHYSDTSSFHIIKIRADIYLLSPTPGGFT